MDICKAEYFGDIVNILLRLIGQNHLLLCHCFALMAANNCFPYSSREM